MTFTKSILPGIPVSTLQPLDKSKLKITKLSPEMAAQMEDVQKLRFRTLVNPAQADNHPSNIYATVKVGGKVVATLYNSGASMTSNADHGKIRKLPSMGDSETLTGPALAQKRAEEIAEKLGGTIEKVATAKTQAQWQSRPPVEWTYDYKAMAEDQAARDAFARTKVDTQLIAQSEKINDDAIVSKFLDFMESARENPGGFMRAQFLAAKGLTEEDVAAMSPEDREKLEQEIEEFIKRKVEEATA